VSYVVGILAGGLPADWAAALGARDSIAEAQDARLENEPGMVFEPAGAEVVELHRRLTSRYPCICDDDSGPWSVGPLINNCGQQRPCVGVSYSRVEEVLPFLVETTTEMGLWGRSGERGYHHLVTLSG
jgi:hypothetical protein